jgi:transposase-like protein
MKRKGPQRNAQKERFWRRAIRQQLRSGQSVREYCRDHEVSEPSFYAWRRELKRRHGHRAEKTPLLAARRLRTAVDPGARVPRVGGCRGVGSSRRPAFVSVQLGPGTVPIGSAPIECLLPNGVVLRLPASMEPAAIAAVLTSWEQSRC